MFKNETLVKWMVCSLLGIGNMAFAQSSTPSSSNDGWTRAIENSRGSVNTCPNAYAKRLEGVDKDRREHVKKKFEELGSAYNQASDPYIKYLDDSYKAIKAEEKTCNDFHGGGNFCPLGAEKTFNEKVIDFAGSCKNMPGISREGESGNIACGYAVARCDCTTLPAGTTAYNALQCSSGPAPVSSSNVPPGGYNLDAAKREFEHCPMFAAADIKDVEKQIREAQKELREAEKRIPEIEQALADAESQGREKEQDANQKMADAAKQWQQQRNDAVKQQREAGKQIAAQVLQKQEAITRNDEARDGLTLNRQKAELERQAAVSKLEDNCHQQALGQTEQAQAKRILNANRGGFNQTLRYYGLTDRTEWQKVAAEFHRRCMRSSVTRNAIKNINRLYEQSLKEAGSGERNLDKRREQLVREMNQLQSSQGCNLGGTGMNEGGVSTETQACQAMRTAKEEMARVDADYRIQQGLNRQALSNAKADTFRRRSAKGRELMQAQSIAQEERARLTNLQEYLRLKQQYAKGAASDSKAADDTRGKHMAMVGAATSLVGCFLPDACQESDSCRQAANYLNLIGRKFDYTKARTPRPSPSASGTDLTPAQPGSRQESGSGIRERE